MDDEKYRLMREAAARDAAAREQRRKDEEYAARRRDIESRRDDYPRIPDLDRRGDNNDYAAREREKILRENILQEIERKKYDVSVSNRTLDQATGNALKIKIENHILTKLSDYIMTNYPRGNDTKAAYSYAVVNVLRNIFKDPNNDIITYIENRLKGEPEKKMGFFGFGGTKRRKRRRKSRRT